mmetsp:Transcript_21575/g.54947  ORF Transcript_21575/g.54947 Transcript_21575/m.54947 type:complete len:302 (-) Transcript_21575:598-1503(-)
MLASRHQRLEQGQSQLHRAGRGGSRRPRWRTRCRNSRGLDSPAGGSTAQRLRPVQVVRVRPAHSGAGAAKVGQVKRAASGPRGVMRRGAKGHGRHGVGELGGCGARLEPSQQGLNRLHGLRPLAQHQPHARLSGQAEARQARQRGLRAPHAVQAAQQRSQRVVVVGCDLGCGQAGRAHRVPVGRHAQRAQARVVGERQGGRLPVRVHHPQRPVTRPQQHQWTRRAGNRGRQQRAGASHGGNHCVGALAAVAPTAEPTAATAACGGCAQGRQLDHQHVRAGCGGHAGGRGPRQPTQHVHAHG